MAGNIKMETTEPDWSEECNHPEITCLWRLEGRCPLSESFKEEHGHCGQKTDYRTLEIRRAMYYIAIHKLKVPPYSGGCTVNLQESAMMRFAIEKGYVPHDMKIAKS